jgi:hypothetical protein
MAMHSTAAAAGLRRQPSREVPSLALALAATHAALEPLAAAQAAADAAPGRIASDESATADVPPPLREQRRAILTVQAVLAAAEAATAAASSEGARPAADSVTDAFTAEIAAAAVRQVVPALTAHLQAALAAIPRQQPPHQAYCRSPHSQQLQQRQPSGSSLHGSWGSGGQHLQASSSATLRFGDFDPGVLGGGGQHGNELPGAFQPDFSKKSSNGSACLLLHCAFNAHAHALVLIAASPAADL